ncbi:YicC/YloC family endoribonuclease [Melioribacteraceae bacterium 4301-Me]|uniref:YicC/YloC family endoribonuclease n=1 Tax=Pyranulibacter aquaticus TaxID=3163344 RepID=UPI003599D017
MITSMTGYGKSIIRENDLLIECEIKSLNNRFLDISLKSPKSLFNKELEIREKVKSRIKRGKIYLSLSISKAGIEVKFPKLDTNGVKFALHVLKEIKKTSKLKNKISLSDVLLFQNFFFEENGDDFSDFFPLIQKAVDAAIDDLEKMRVAEGKELEKDLINRVKLIETALDKIEQLKKSTIKEYFSRVKERAKNLTQDILDNPNRLDTELALLVDRYDITEECVRLRSHIKLFLDTVHNSDDPGRKLNFIVQEMNREANTINSKTISAEISHYGISIKEELEKIREQIQNIE